MSTLAVKTLSNTHIVQTLSFKEDKIIDCIRLHLLKNGVINNCTLNIMFYFKTGELAGFPASSLITLSSTEINKLPEFWHGMKYIDCKNKTTGANILIKKPVGVESIEIELHVWLTGDLGTDNNFLGLVCKENPVTEENHENVWDNSFGLELYCLS